MKALIILLAILAALAAANASNMSVGGSGVIRQAAKPNSTAVSSQGSLPRSFCFIENRGQWPADVRYVTRAANMQVRAERHAIVLRMPDAAGDPELEMLVRIEVAGKKVSLQPVGEQVLPGLHHYLIGNDPSGWTRDVQRFSRVRYPCVAEGIDLVLREESGMLEYDLDVEAGADLSALAFICKGIERLELDDDGSLLLRTGLGTMRQSPPRSEVSLPDGSRRKAIVHFRVLGDDRFGFVAEGINEALSLRIDPGLIWSSYVGSSGSMGGSEMVTASAVDTHGCVTVTGWANGFDFPTTPGALAATPPGGSLVLVTKFDASGNLIFSSTIGQHDGGSRGVALALDSLGRATVGGRLINGTSFPTTAGAFDTVRNSIGLAGFALRLSEAGSSLVFSTLIEGNAGGSQVNAIDVAPSGAAVVGGFTAAPTFPVTSGAFDTTLTPVQDGFVSRLDPTGSYLEWSTFLGGVNTDDVTALQVDSNDQVTVVGLTGSPDFPVTAGTFGQTFGNGAGSFITRINAQGSALVWSTFLKGFDAGTFNYASATALTLEPTGGLVVVGTCRDPSFPTTPGALFLANPPSSTTHSFVSRVNSTGSALVYSTLLSFAAIARDVVVDASGVATIAGQDPNATMPTTPGAYDVAHHGADAFVARISPTGTKLYYSTMFGSQGFDDATTLALIAPHVVAVGGYAAPGLPTTPGAFDPNFNGGLDDCFTAVFDLFLQGSRAQGQSSPACLGDLAMNVTSMPSGGASGFGFYCSGAPPSSQGWLILGYEAVTPTLVQGAWLHLDPSKRIWRIAVQSNSSGFTETAFPLTAIPTGVHFAAQYVFLNTPTCPGAGVLASSHAVVIDVQ